MKYAVIYQSKSGNTKFLAETICDEWRERNASSWILTK